ncbi:MAG: Verru_Chthon cassette protein C [Verrucomicrobia bacterium]|nr:Verru_Chthon cassette protein C [Verrucomicrobiota bacterium]
MNTSTLIHRILTRKLARTRGFSLPELLVSIAILSLLMLFTFQMMEQTQRTWLVAKENTTSYKEARAAFEVMTRRLSQATLNTYWGYDNDGDDKKPPTKYEKKSELHFVVVNAKEALGEGPDGSRPAHAVFFNAPLGFTAESAPNGTPVYSNMEMLLNSWGYFVEFSSDEYDRPSFLNKNNTIKKRLRYRLMEFREPSENLSIYSEPLHDVKSKTQLYRWFSRGNTGVNATVNRSSSLGANDVRTVRPVAENIIALVLAPRLPEFDRNDPDFIAPNYVYDTRELQWGKEEERTLLSEHQLPPLMQVTMVAVDELDMARWLTINGQREPDFVSDSLFKSQRSLEQDLETLRKDMDNQKVRHRVFTTTIRMRESKWTEPDNKK